MWAPMLPGSRSYEVVSIVLPILHLRKLKPKIILFIVGRARVWTQDLLVGNSVLLIGTLLSIPSLSAPRRHPKAVSIISSAPV